MTKTHRREDSPGSDRSVQKLLIPHNTSQSMRRLITFRTFAGVYNLQHLEYCAIACWCWREERKECWQSVTRRSIPARKEEAMKAYYRARDQEERWAKATKEAARHLGA